MTRRQAPNRTTRSDPARRYPTFSSGRKAGGFPGHTTARRPARAALAEEPRHPGDPRACDTRPSERGQREGVELIHVAGLQRQLALEEIHPRPPFRGPSGVDDPVLLPGREAAMPGAEAVADHPRIEVGTKRREAGQVFWREHRQANREPRGGLRRQAVEPALHHHDAAVVPARHGRGRVTPDRRRRAVRPRRAAARRRPRGPGRRAPARRGGDRRRPAVD